METIDRFFRLTEFFNDEKKFLGDGYYRLKNVDNKTYEIEFSQTDACGSSIAQPKIKILIENGNIKPVMLMDMSANPMIFIRESDEHAQITLAETFNDLLIQFEGKLDNF